MHRYDNEPDILAVDERGYSDVYTRSRDDDFQYVAVVPTKAAKTTVAVVARATSCQYAPRGGKPWPGRPDKYPVRVDVKNVQLTEVSLIREAMELAGFTWAAQWTVKVVELELDRLFADDGRAAAVLEHDGSLPGEIEDDKADLYTEGAVRSVQVNSYERDPKARRACLKHFGAVCQVCETDFVEEYGPAGDGIIHVHHRKALSEIGKSYQVDPKKDLVPVCPNCHAVIHRQNPAYTVEEVRAMRAAALSKKAS